MSADLYIISKKRILYFEDKKRTWDYNFKNSEDRADIINHLKENKARISFAK